MTSPESIAVQGPVAPGGLRSAPGKRFRRSLGAAAAELALIAVLYLVYRSGRLLVADHVAAALANADRVHRWEAWLHLPSEALIQSDAFSESLFQMANVYYVSVHFPIMIAFLLLGYVWRSREQYRWARTLVVVQTGVALVIHLVFPLAPPRMFARWGFVDTMSLYGPSAYEGAAASVANQFAAMPSLHVGWAVTIAYVMARTAPRWVAVLTGIHAAITVAVVVVTANHWWLDALVAIALFVLTVLAFPEPGRYRFAELVARRRSARSGTA